MSELNGLNCCLDFLFNLQMTLRTVRNYKMRFLGFVVLGFSLNLFQYIICFYKINDFTQLVFIQFYFYIPVYYFKLRHFLIKHYYNVVPLYKHYSINGFRFHFSFFVLMYVKIILMISKSVVLI